MNTSFAHNRSALRAAARRAAALVLAGLLLAGCATLPPPTDELAAAQQAVARASEADADQYAPDELNTARAELGQAQVAMANGRQGDARNLAVTAAAGGDLAYALSRATTLRQQYAQRSAQIASLREQLGLEPGGDALPVPPSSSPDDTAPAATPAQRLQALEATPELTGLAAYERLQAQQAVAIAADARSSQRLAATVVAARRVSIAELAARSAWLERALARLDSQRSELLVEASRREAERARQEAERLRVQAQIQAEEAQRLRAEAEAAAAARQQAEDVIIDVGGEQAARLKAARKREAELARQEAALRAAQEAADEGDAPR